MTLFQNINLCGKNCHDIIASKRMILMPCVLTEVVVQCLPASLVESVQCRPCDLQPLALRILHVLTLHVRTCRCTEADSW